MGVENTKSTEITNLDATPAKPNDLRYHEGRQRSKFAAVAVAAADDDNSVYRLHRVRSSWFIPSLKLAHDAIAGGTDYNLGFYDPASRGGAIVGSGNELADALDLSRAALAALTENSTSIGGTQDGGFATLATAWNGSTDPTAAESTLLIDAIREVANRANELGARQNGDGVVWREVAFENRNIANCLQPVWSILGLSADPEQDYDICLTGITVGTGAGDIVSWLTYFDGS